MRILQVIPFWTPEKGGSAKVAYQISSYLAKSGHDVVVATTDYGINQACFVDDNLKVHYFKNIFSKWGFYLSPQIYAWAKNHVHEFDIIHLHEVRTFQNAAISYFARKQGIPYVLSAHGTLPVVVQRKLAKRVFDILFGRSIVNSARFLLAVSLTEAAQYREAGLDQNRIRVVYNGLDLDEFSDLPSRGIFRSRFPELNHETKVILFLGRLHQRKGINHLIEAYSHLQMDLLDSFLIIAGPNDGDLANLQALRDRLGLNGKMRFVGPLYDKDKLAAFVDADVLVSPAIYEIFGLVPFEALLCGSPVIVGDDWGTAELIRSSQAGYLVRYGDVQQLANTILHVLSHSPEAQQKVLNGQVYVRQKLDWNTIIVDIENIYSESIK